MADNSDGRHGEVPIDAAPVDDPARERMLERLRGHVGTGRLTLA